MEKFKRNTNKCMLLNICDLPKEAMVLNNFRTGHSNN